ncbi:MAG: tRNA (guanosine(37)-N1)-methyltransferase TrmD [Candidatus Magasanikbacteria bacterium]|nr:tRNA (guanosine(37)-N1)-methyltransferase TrmD [Candidatus Magasanikbacteria bacterium]
MKFNIVTIFPELISQYSNESILGRAQKNKFIKINAINLRDFSENKHKKVDDTPYGGGAGMVMKPEPIYRALKSVKALPFKTVDGLSKIKKILTGEVSKNKKTILLSPRGAQFDQRMAEKFSKYKELTFVCGRYEGVDQRVVERMVDEEISVGPYILAGGELGALIITEAVSRLVPGVLGNPKSLDEETFGKGEKGSGAEYSQYTKPADFKGWKVPKILLSGDHKKIEDWRKNV